MVLILVGDAVGKRFYTGKDLVDVMREWEKSKNSQDHDTSRAAHLVGFVMGFTSGKFNRNRIAASRWCTR
jgi:hypothetical protein